MQPTFRRARLGGRSELRPRQIGLEKFVCDDQRAVCIAVEQMMAAGTPEIAPFAMQTRAQRLPAPVRSRSRTYSSVVRRDLLGPAWGSKSSSEMKATRQSSHILITSGRRADSLYIQCMPWSIAV